MIKAFTVVDLWTQKEKEAFAIFASRLDEKHNACDLAGKLRLFLLWKEATVKIRKHKMEMEQKEKVINILKTSVRGQRTTVEKETLRRFIIANLTCVPKSVTFSEMDQLCNELDWIPLIGRSILFLQGDFGNVYYMIAYGTVGLYLEPSKDREMAIGREFGSLRAQPYHGTDEDLKGLGNNIFNLPRGAGFGEYAILASSNKIRSCAAVALDDDSMMLIMHAETYNAVLRQHHYRQKQLSSATALLSELPLFKTYNYSKIASIAYTMRSQTYTAQSPIATFGEVINNVILIVSGQVKVFAAPGAVAIATRGREAENDKDKVAKIIEKRIPRLAVSMLGRGQIIGELEMHKQCRTFQMSYVAGSACTEVLEMPSTVYKENVGTADFRQSPAYRSVEELNAQNEERRASRLARAYDAMKGMMGGTTREVKSKDELLSVLPVLIDPKASTASKSSTEFSPRGMASSAMCGAFNDPDALRVTRKASFKVTLSPDETYSPKELAGRKSLATASVKQSKTALTYGSKPSTGSPSVSSPRVVNFRSTLPSQRGGVQ